jgi:hypothetical protein
MIWQDCTGVDHQVHFWADCTKTSTNGSGLYSAQLDRRIFEGLLGETA